MLFTLRGGSKIAERRSGAEENQSRPSAGHLLNGLHSPRRKATDRDGRTDLTVTMNLENPPLETDASAQTADVIVVGAGLAGLSCAFELAEAGLRPVVLEAKPWTGGRTSSWRDEGGMELESGLHR